MTERLSDGPDGIDRAAHLLRAGALVAFGTETVYGLGADATSGAAVASVFDAKGRPHFNPLICHYPEAGAAFRHVVASDVAVALAAVNVFGGFMVTRRMLEMFRKKERKAAPKEGGPA